MAFSNLAPGLYFIRIDIGGKKEKIKIVKS
ncbi:MAG: T9SS type A sorting domain-containing protein [Bacteroidota bacterium]|nr:T9SS type A sorting domain-containing protein [Bacteroidota bacterium]